MSRIVFIKPSKEYPELVYGMSYYGYLGTGYCHVYSYNNNEISENDYLGLYSDEFFVDYEIYIQIKREEKIDIICNYQRD